MHGSSVWTMIRHFKRRRPVKNVQVNDGRTAPRPAVVSLFYMAVCVCAAVFQSHSTNTRPPGYRLLRGVANHSPLPSRLYGGDVTLSSRDLIKSRKMSRHGMF